MAIGILLLWGAVVLYGAAALFTGWSLCGGPAPVARAATPVMAAGLALQTLSLLAQSLVQHHAPIMTLLESLAFTAWALVALYLLFTRTARIAVFGLPVGCCAVGLLISGACFSGGGVTTLAPAFQSPWRDIHILSSLISYASFTLAFGAAVGYGLQASLLKRKRLTPLQQHLPTLHTVDRLAYRMVTFGFLMLTLGIGTGALWAQSAWGSYWNWDPKETWTLVTWLIYAAYLHVRVIQGQQGKWANRLLITGFASILITYFGISLLAHSLHSYR